MATLATALSTTTTATNTATTNTASPSIRKRRTKLFFSHIYDYLNTVYRFVCSIILFHSKRTPISTNRIAPASTTTTTATATAAAALTHSVNKKNNIPAAMQYYKGKTLILDLDETLIHSVRLGSEESMQKSVSPSVIRKKIEVICDKQSLIYEVYKRPHVDFFLKTISQWYKVVIYTASMAEYADPVIDWLDQDSVISQRFFRQSCVVKNGNFLKDLTLAEPDLSKVCLVDNSPVAFDLYKDNGIALPSWISNPNDESLLDLLPFLDALRFTADVRSILRLQHKIK